VFPIIAGVEKCIVLYCILLYSGNLDLFELQHLWCPCNA